MGTMEAQPPDAPAVPAGHLRPLLVLALLPAILMSPGLFGGKALFAVHPGQLQPWSADLPADELAALEAVGMPLAADGTLQFRPQQRVAFERLRAGEVPHWNPDSLCGVPLLAQAVHGVFHPPNWLHLVLEEGRAYAWIAALQTFLAGLFAYALCRQLGLGGMAGLLGGLSFALCGFLAVRWHWYQIQGAAMWLPLVLLGVERLTSADRPGAGRGAVACIAGGLGLSFLAGFPPASVLITYAAAAWALVRLSGRCEDRLRKVLRLGFALVVGVAIGLPQMLPSTAWALSGESTRTSVDPEIVAGLAMGPASLARLVLPDIFGHPHDLATHELPFLRERGTLGRIAQKANANHIENAGSFGLVALMLALLGLGSGCRGRWLAALLLAVGLFCAVQTPLLPLVLKLPGLDTSDPRRFLLLAGMGGALLGACGLQRIIDRGPGPAFRNLAVVALMAFIGAALLMSLVSEDAWVNWAAPRLAEVAGVSTAEVRSHRADLDIDLALTQMTLWGGAVVMSALMIAVLMSEKRRRTGALLLILVAAADLGVTARRGAVFVPPHGIDAPPPALASLTSDGRLIRFHPGPPSPMTMPLPPNTALPFGVRDVSGYITLAPRRVEALHERLQVGTAWGVGTAPLSDPAALGSGLLDDLAVDRLLSSVPLDHPDWRVAGSVGDAVLYTRDAGASRLAAVWPCDVIPVPPGADAALDALVAERASGGRRTVIEATDLTVPTGCIKPDDWQALSSGALAWRVDTPERLEIATRSRQALTGDAAAADTGFWLVLRDTWAPGWSAHIDSRPVEIHVADGAFRGVRVPVGEHTVVFTYASPGWTWGLRLGLAGLFLFLLAVLRALLPRRSDEPRTG